MKALIVYDSAYGNIEKIAKSIGGAITGDVKVLRADTLNPSERKICRKKSKPLVYYYLID